jgi:hypothetical protein
MTDRLRAILRLDALLCTISGAAALAAATTVGDVFDAAGTGIIRVTGAALIAYAAFLALSATRGRSDTAVRRVGALSAEADAAWTIGAVVLALTGATNALLVVASAPVAALGITKALTLRGNVAARPAERAAQHA